MMEEKPHKARPLASMCRCPLSCILHKYNSLQYNMRMSRKVNDDEGQNTSAIIVSIKTFFVVYIGC